MSLQGQTASQIAESRPLPRDRKKLGLFKRWVISIRRFPGHSFNDNINNHNNNHNNTNRDRTHSNGTHSMTSSSSSPALDIFPCSASSSIEGLIDFPQNHTQYNTIKRNSNINCKNKVTAKHMATYYPSRHASLTYDPSPAHASVPKNIFQWMQADCPKDIIPLILAFAGPQKIALIERTNRFWRQVMQQEGTWRRLCEELYKWKEGDEAPNSWKKYYQYNPCVPVDYSNIHNALNDAIGNAKDDPSEPSIVRVLLRPGRYVLREAITVDEGSAGKNTGDYGNNRSVAIAIETMEYTPENYHHGDHHCHTSIFRLPSNKSKRKRISSIRSIFQCRTVDIESEDEEDILDHESLHEYLNNVSSSSEGRSTTPNGVVEEDERSVRTPTAHESTTDTRNNCGNSNKPIVNRATLVLTTRRHNEPLLRIHQGSCTVRNIDLKHGSFGNDIWNGNAAIQIQPPLGPNGDPIDVPAPTVILDRVDVTSSSGRGVVNIDGGHMTINSSFIHDCAATGIYVGGSGSQAILEKTDVLFNGKGNKRNRRGITRGHSGIYMEQGRAKITDCNISGNSLTGISVISPDNALITLQESDLVSNGTFQLELPAVGTASYNNCVTVNNNLASHGIGRPRSGFLAK